MALAAVFMFSLAPTHAQIPEEEWRLFNDILNSINSVDEDTARQAHAECVGHSKRLAQMPNVSAIQRLSLEAEIENCISYAMHRGEFSDDTGDQCSHHYTYAGKMAEVIKLGVNEPLMTAETWANLAERLKRQIDIGPDMGCASDYSAFLPALNIAEEQAAKPPPPPQFPLVVEVEGFKYAIKAETAREQQKGCVAVLQKAGAQTTMPMAEKLYSEAKAEDCIATAKVIGNYSDELGTVCDHHFRFAQKLAASIAAAPSDPAFTERILPFAIGELETAMRQGPDMGCTQDYKGLKVK